MEERVIRHNVTYSKKEKMILFLPAKTGTIHASFIFNHWDFTTDLFEQESGEIHYNYNSVIHHHSMYIPKDLKHYSIITTARNPYTRLVSAYYNSQQSSLVSKKPIGEFKEYFSVRLQNGFDYHQDDNFFPTEPHYFLRVENLYHDYIQVPFIRDSKLNKSGLLYELCNKKLHATSVKAKPLREYYTQDMADHLYQRYKSYFELLGYDKDSWKK